MSFLDRRATMIYRAVQGIILGVLLGTSVTRAGYDFKYCHGGAEGTCFGITASTRSPQCHAIILEVGTVNTTIGLAKGIQYTLYTGGACTGTPSSSFGSGVTTLAPPFLNHVFSVSIALTEPTWQALGCYTDIGPRTLPGASMTSSSLQTVKVCQDFCHSSGYKYAGVEYGKECWCDHAIRPPGAPAPSTDCNMICGGVHLDICGGPNRLNVYYNDNGIPGPSNPTTVGAYTYRGCYTDNPDARVLENRYDNPESSGGITPVTCAALCAAHNYTIVGLEFSHECWCGNVLKATSTKVDDNECRTACPSDDSFYCGHNDRLNIWSIDDI